MTQGAATSGGTSETAEAAAPAAQGRAGNIALWVLQVVTAVVFLMAAFTKFSGSAQVVATFDAIGFGDWFMYLIGALEVAGAVALLIPLLSGLAGLAFVGLMIGAIVFSVVAIGGGAAVPAVVLVAAAIIAWGRRRRTAELVGLVRGRG